MSENQNKGLDEKFEAFAKKYKLKFIIPLVIFGLIALSNVKAAAAFGAFMGVAWFIGFAASGSMWSVDKVLPNALNEKTRIEVLCVVGVVVFLGLSWIIGNWS